jgi:predicted transcriptional regulator
MRTVKDILDKKTPVFNQVDPDVKVIQGLQQMSAVNLSYLVVVKEDKFLGIFSERDYSRNVILKGLHSDTTAIKEVMSHSLPFVSPAETVENCMHLLNSHKTRYLVVFDDEQFVGVITINDVLREALASKELVFDEKVIKETTELQDRVF